MMTKNYIRELHAGAVRADRLASGIGDEKLQHTLKCYAAALEAEALKLEEEERSLPDA
jgi:hypothetical protein